MYFLKSISDDVQLAQLEFGKHHKTKRLIFGSVLACMAAVFQAAGGYLPGIGYLISPLATLPILICAMFSLPIGVLSYILTIILLIIVEPSELIVFPFTTGLLGLGIGVGFSFLRKRLSIISVGAISLLIGIMILIYVFRFPILGPTLSGSISFLTTVSISSFAFFYSVLWVEIGLFFFKRLRPIAT
ncbi:hypothetical protein DYI25_05935 [Mesobacillus boroniphilus]|uniref:Uncharacterized protein n=1 Tax=Mesobacillus boroniphilus TaxID=308892 RepID=A0A944CK82_9BACI|nr:hypothetical protein [Mesobacillus boroniphilus]MBS8263972.1 hypothetical protein [Mesobacillus boroniphilus]